MPVVRRGDGNKGNGIMAEKRVCRECKERTPTGGDMLCDECRRTLKAKEDAPPAGTVLPGDGTRAAVHSAIRHVWCILADAHDAGMEMTTDDLDIWGAITKHGAIQDKVLMAHERRETEK